MDQYFGKLPYQLALRFAQLFFTSKLGLKIDNVWARNSFALNTLVPLVSDLDLSVMVPSADQFEIFKKTEGCHLKMKSVIPFIGEINVYSEETLPLIWEFSNPFELARDPILEAKLSLIFSKRAPSHFHAAVFVLRMLESDYHNLVVRPKVRMKKWNSHFASLKLKLPQVTFLKDFELDAKNLIQQIISVVVMLCGNGNPISSQSATKWLELYFELVEKKVSLEKMSLMLSSQPWWTAFFPHHFCHFSKEISHLDDQLLEVFLCQLDWELTGLLTQGYLVNRLEVHQEQLKRIFNMQQKVEFVNSHEKIQLASSRIRKVEKVFQNIGSEKF